MKWIDIRMCSSFLVTCNVDITFFNNEVFPAAAMERISISKKKFSKDWKSLPSQCSMLSEQASLQSLAKQTSDL